MEEVKTGYIVEYKNEPAKVISVLMNTCVIQVNDHRKTVRLSEVRILSRDSNTDVRTLQVCKKCNQIKLPDEFPRLKGDKRRDICTECWGKNISEKKAKKADKAGQSETEYDTDEDELRKLANRIVDIVEKKNHDYNHSFERNVERFGDVAALIPLSNKLDRIEALQKEPAKVKESLYDSTVDLIGYALLYAMIQKKREVNL
ncbi:DUF1599 domain-containing protein [Aerococcaceae bacterium zg-B36]|uniref:nucleotide modification associated domain-containing protein n=1 Tax=Aerococcaceae bacterium zg-252 TaxID=2796928 RepID=UPI001BD89CF2|nr:DUF1599 domain-containing protein [Aerococcaceae bacterium zg-B36]